MLPLYGQFLLKQGIRSNLYLTDPPVTLQGDLFLPRFSVLHHLELSDENHFPDRTLYYFQDVSENKKIPIKHQMDLTHKEGVSTLLNRYLPQEIRAWSRANIRTFKEIDLTKTPNTDTAVVSVYNYNPLKDLYRYTASPLARYQQYSNLARTYWDGVKASLDADTASYAIIPIELPTVIPSVLILERLTTLNSLRLSRVVTDVKLLWLFDLYKWLVDKHRITSALGDISDKDAERIVVELKFKGYSSFLPLSLLRNLSSESPVKSSVKLEPIKLSRLFVLCLHRLQDKVTQLLESQQQTPEPTETQPELIDDDTDDEPDTPINQPKALTAQEPKLSELKEVQAVVDDKAFSGVDEFDFDKLLEEAQTDSFSDKFFEDKLNKLEVGGVSKTTEQEALEEERIKTYTPEQTKALLITPTAAQVADRFVQRAVDAKTHTSAELRALRKTLETRSGLKSPYNPTETLDTYVDQAPTDIAVSEETTKIKVDNPLVHEDLKSDPVGGFDRMYLKNLYRQDIVSCVRSLEKSGLIIKNYEVEDTVTATDNYETHKLTIKPLDGKESSIYFRIPKIDSEGVFEASGIRYKMRKQRTDLPIRKISPIRVALTSNYGKLFVGRTERKTNDPVAYLIKYIQSDYLGDSVFVKKIVPGAKTLNKQTLPNSYHILSSVFNEVHTTEFTLLLVKDDITNYIKPEVAKAIEAKGYLFCGYRKNNNILVIDKNSQFYDYTENLTPLGGVEELFHLDKDKIPKPFSTAKVLGDDIPLGVCFGYYLGLSGLLAVTNTQYQILGPRQQHKTQTNELVLRFSDAKLVLQTDTTEKALLFNGFLFYKEFTKQHELALFDQPDIYLNMVEQRGSGLIHIKELDNLKSMFLDPITVDVLEQMKEPTEFLQLLLRANQLLENYRHPDINDPLLSRIRGYDRVPGLMYRALAESVREYKLKSRTGSKINLDPYKVWNYVTQDNTVKTCEDLNPVLNMKETEAVTLTGADGLNKDATPKELRRFHPNDAGLMSEATVDSSDVALNLYLVPYAKFTGVRGMIDPQATGFQQNKAKVFSSSLQIAPMSEYDDAKRIN